MTGKVLLVMFDARMKTFTDKRNYRVFQRKLIGEGFSILQKSVYIRSATSSATSASQIARIKKFTPSGIKVRIICLPQHVFECMINVNCDVVDCVLPCVISI